MIARVWRGETWAERADRYYEYLLETGVAECRKTPGNVGVSIWRCPTGATVEFLFISYWSSMEAIHAFAGDDLSRAVYYPADKDFLLTMDPTVRHYDVPLHVTAADAVGSGA